MNEDITKENFILKSDKAEISTIENLISQFNKIALIPEEKIINFQIAVSEALINAIVHGNKEDINKSVFVAIECKENFFKISIKDEGSGFDYKKIPDPTKEENLFKEHGRGIFIMNTLVDEFDCNSSVDGTEFILSVKN